MADRQVRVTVMVPEETREQIYNWADQIGVKSSHFCSMALVAGARHMMRQFAPEMFLSPEMIQMMADNLEVDANQLREALEAQEIEKAKSALARST